ncbi:hypothetical protein AX16_003894 [Volvariella volvacea WC 439]|nr:hypothetical protein AX16_003894 [Volvariella volvacea WC 439]
MSGVKRAREKLQELAVTEAIQPRDVPPTKLGDDVCLAIILSIISWIENKDRDRNVFWLHGPDGTGKSTVLTKTAERLDRKDSKAKVAGSFFFCWGDPLRENLTRLIPTLACRLAICIKAVGKEIDAVIEEDPKILEASLESQWRKLIIEPVMTVIESGGSIPPAVIIINGLDQCKGKVEQTRVLELIGSCGPHFPIAFLVTTRPRDRLYNTLDRAFVRLCSAPINLDAWASTWTEIRSRLTEVFQKGSQNLGGYSLNEDQPSDEIVNRLTIAANGERVYVQVLFRYLDQAGIDLDERLKGFLEYVPEGPSSLDDLYAQIIRSSYRPKSAESQDLLFLICSDVLNGSLDKSVSELAWILGLDFDECRSRLMTLSPLLDISDDNSKDIGTQDASFIPFSQFLFEKGRSEDYYVDKKVCAARIMERCLLKLKETERKRIPDRALTLCWWNCSRFLEQPGDVPDSLMQLLHDVHFDLFLNRLSRAFLYRRFAFYLDQYRHFGATCTRLGDRSLVSQYPERAIEYAMFARWLVIHYSCLLHGYVNCPLPNTNSTLDDCEHSLEEQRPLSWKGLMTLVRAHDAYHGLPEIDRNGSLSHGLMADDLVCGSLAVLSDVRWLQMLSMEDIEHLSTWSRAWVSYSQVGFQVEERQDRDKKLKSDIIKLLRQLPGRHHHHELNRGNVLSWLKHAFTDEDRPTDLVSHWEAEICSSPTTPQAQDSFQSDEGVSQAPEGDSGAQTGTNAAEIPSNTRTVSRPEGQPVELVADPKHNEASPAGNDSRTPVTTLSDADTLPQYSPRANNNQGHEMNSEPNNGVITPMNNILPWIGFGIASAVVLVQWWQMSRTRRFRRV